MKTGIFTPCLSSFYRIPKALTSIFVVLSLVFSSQQAVAQCGTGYTASQVNWDNLDYLVSTGNYAGFVTAAMANTQNFTMGPNRVTVSAVNMTLGGENGTHTGNLPNYTGDDVQYTATAIGATITITFESEVTNANFTLYDIDRSAVFSVAATNALAVAQNVTVTTPALTTLTIGGVPTLRTISAAGGALGNNVTTGAATVTIAGPVKTIVITNTILGTDPIFWLSDINGCVTGSFPNSYYQVSRPWQGGMTGGQPAYFLNIVDDSVYITDPTTGLSKYLFTDAASLGKVNSIGYDPYSHIMYFVYSLTGAASTNKTLRKYDFNTETFSTITTNITTLVGIPTFDQGVESGAAAFYNGSLYFGVEASNPARNSGREHIIWKIDFNALGNPYRATQFAGTPSDGGGALAHDWSDFIISNGILYDFDGAASSVNIDHYDMMTGVKTVYTPTFTPRQNTVLWDESIYEVGANGNTTYEAGHVQPYNLNGTVNSALNMPLVQPPGITLRGSWGDAGEAFRPKSDFGDAPATYDPNPLAPATHERLTTLRLGNTYDYEWVLTSSGAANADGADEDAIGAAPILNYDATLTYTLPNISVFNNTGANATLIAWLDFDFDGEFDAGEGRSTTVFPSGSAQLISLSWVGIYVPPTTNLNTFLRIRLTSAANGMTTANMNGWYPDGEVEDYPVVLGAALPHDIVNWDLTKTKESTVKISWNTQTDRAVQNYEILRSADQQSWEVVTRVAGNGAGKPGSFSYTDLKPLQGIAYYRIKINFAGTDGANRLTEVKTIKVDGFSQALRIQPNPVHSEAVLQITANKYSSVKIEVLDINGKRVIDMFQGLTPGVNSIPLRQLNMLTEGVYTVKAIVEGNLLTTSFIKSR